MLINNGERKDMAERQYLNGLQKIVDQGQWIENERTGKRCLTHPRIIMEYDVGNNVFPLGTTRHCFWKAAVKEIIGYAIGLNNAHDFEELGTKTWLANANENESWLNNPHRKGPGDMGQAYRMRPIGYVPFKHRDVYATMEEAAEYDGIEPDQFRRVYEMLLRREDDRGLIINMWRPETFDKSCLRPCMYSHHFTLIGDTLYLDSEQR
jgi:thymidylate synthase